MSDILQTEAQSKLRILQAIYASLIGGAALFAGIALVLSAQASPAGSPPADMLIFRIVWAVLFVSMIGAVVALRAFLPRAAGKQIGAEAGPAELAGPFFVTTIMTGAMFEGTSLFGGIILLLGGQPVDLLLALLPLAIMLPFFPRAATFEKFVDAATGRERTAEGLTAPARDYRDYR